MGILIVNFSKIQFDISVTNKNSPRDGMLDIVVLKAGNAFGLLPALFARAIDHEGNFKDSPETIETFQAREVVVEADPPMQIRVGRVRRTVRRRGRREARPLDRQEGLGESQGGGGCCRRPTRNLLAGCRSSSLANSQPASNRLKSRRVIEVRSFPASHRFQSARLHQHTSHGSTGLTITKKPLRRGAFDFDGVGGGI